MSDVYDCRSKLMRLPPRTRIYTHTRVYCTRIRAARLYLAVRFLSFSSFFSARATCAFDKHTHTHIHIPMFTAMLLQFFFFFLPRLYANYRARLTQRVWKNWPGKTPAPVSESIDKTRKIPPRSLSVASLRTRFNLLRSDTSTFFFRIPFSIRRYWPECWCLCSKSDQNVPSYTQYKSRKHGRYAKIINV